MAYDGLVVSATVKEFRERLIGGKIAKITQPEKDEIHLVVRNQKENTKVQISVNPSLPLCTVYDGNKPSPVTAPNFCMTLRKHIGNGLITDVRQPEQKLHMDGLERVILFEIEHLDEMGDRGKRILSVELMGKYSNIILLREDYTIIDSIRRISASQSSVREVLPNRPYFIPDAGEKKNPLALTEMDFTALMSSQPEPTFKALFHSITGLSPVTASEMCFRAGVDPDLSANCQREDSLKKLYTAFFSIINQVAIDRRPDPVILYKEDTPVEFSAFPLTMYCQDEVSETANAYTTGSTSSISVNKDATGAEYRCEHYASMSEVIHHFYEEKDTSSRIRQRSTDLRKVLNTLMERESKKLMLQEKQLKSTEGKDKYRVYGELLHTYGYSLEGGEDHLDCENYYTNEEIRIPLDSTLSASENAKHYLDRYDKLKRTEQNVTIQLQETKRTLEHLESIETALSLAEGEEDLADLRREMQDFGYLHHIVQKKTEKLQKKSKPYHFVSSDGYEIFIGKNNYQNEEVTFKIADGGDLWFHAKNVPGSHVIVKTGGKPFSELPDRLFLEAAGLAAYYSSHQSDQKVEVDYTLRKNLRKVPNAAPGFVIYHTNYSITVAPQKLA